MTPAVVLRITIAGFFAFIFGAASFMIGNYTTISEKTPLAVAFVSACAWAIGSVPAGPGWWNGNTNIVAAWLAAISSALQVHWS